MVLSFFGNGCHLPGQIKILNFILNACCDIFLSFLAKLVQRAFVTHLELFQKQTLR